MSKIKGAFTGVTLALTGVGAIGTYLTVPEVRSFLHLGKLEEKALDLPPQEESQKQQNSLNQRQEGQKKQTQDFPPPFQEETTEEIPNLDPPEIHAMALNESITLKDSRTTVILGKQKHEKALNLTTITNNQPPVSHLIKRGTEINISLNDSHWSLFVLMADYDSGRIRLSINKKY